MDSKMKKKTKDATIRALRKELRKYKKQLDIEYNQKNIALRFYHKSMSLLDSLHYRGAFDEDTELRYYRIINEIEDLEERV